HVAEWVDGRIVEVRPAAVDRAPPAEHRGDLRELLEPEEVRDIPVLERRARGVHRGDRRGRRRWEDRRRVDELRTIAPPRALAQLSEERRDALVAEHLELPPAEAIREDHDDLLHAFAPRRPERRKRWRGRP